MSCLPVVILAGGRSSRMGLPDKCLLSLDDKTVLQHVLDKAKNWSNYVLINANGNPQNFSAFGVPVRSDYVPDYCGPLAGVLTGMAWAVETYPSESHIFTVPADMPFLPNDLAARFQVSEVRRDEVRIAVSAGIMHPTIGFWPVSLAAILERDVLNGVRKMRDWVVEQDVTYIDCSDEWNAFFNINTKQDLDAARSSMVETRKNLRAI